MSGDNELQGRAQDKMNKIMQVLDSYESTLALPNHNPPAEQNELNEYFSWDRSTIENLTIEECGSTAYKLNQYAFYIQREINRENSRIRWAKVEIDLAIAPLLSNYNHIYNHEAKLAAASKENSYTISLMNIIRYAEQRVDRLAYLSKNISALADNLISIQKAKIYVRKNDNE